MNADADHLPDIRSTEPATTQWTPAAIAVVMLAGSLSLAVVMEGVRGFVVQEPLPESEAQLISTIFGAIIGIVAGFVGRIDKRSSQ